MLRTPCEPVTSFDESLRSLVRDLLDTIDAAPGRAAVAANQIGVGLRVFAYDAAGERGHLVNPTLVVGEESQHDDEGCLSLPGLAFATTRAEHVMAHGFDERGEPLAIEATGFLARALQHETDHLDGFLYIDRLVGDQRRQALRAVRASGWGRPTAVR